MEAKKIIIALDDLIHEQTSIEITIPTAISFIESLQKENEELQFEDRKKERFIVEMAKNMNKLKDGNYDFLRDENTKLKERVKELEEDVKEIDSKVEDLLKPEYMNTEYTLGQVKTAINVVTKMNFIKQNKKQ